MANAPVGNEPVGKLVEFPSSKNGAEKISLNWIKYGRGRTSNIPKPPLRDVFPSRNGSQEKPTRGSKLRSVGFEKREPVPEQLPGTNTPQTGSGSVRLRRTVVLP